MLELLVRQLLRHAEDSGGPQLHHALLAEAVSGELLAGERAELTPGSPRC